MSDRPAIIVAANSARALAASAKRAGFAPLAIDVFGDADTREMSLAALKLEGGLFDGLTLDKVVGAAAILIEDYNPIGLVYGSGFEHQPEAVGAIARMTRIFGNDAETLTHAKDPVVVARLCAEAHIFHPPIAFATPEEPEHWLLKRRGGAGGAHIASAIPGRRAPPDHYFQRRVTGQNISALFVADGKNSGIIGLSVQWCAPTPTSPFRYGGAAGPVEIGVAEAEGIERCVASVSSELGLVGLNSADFVVSNDAVWLIEINPRPGATLDVFEPNGGALFAHHIAACDGRLMPAPSSLAFKAAEVVYAPCDIASTERRDWPDWTADRPPRGTRIAAGDPLCTSLASGATLDLARIRATEQARWIIAAVQETNP